MTIGDGICQSIDIRNDVDNFKILKECRVIEGFLQIVLIENNTEADFENVTFPELREITGYFLLYRVDGLKSLNKLFPNLEVIRGDILLTDYAFMIYEMKNLQEVRVIRALILLLLLLASSTSYFLTPLPYLCGLFSRVIKLTSPKRDFNWVITVCA